MLRKKQSYSQWEAKQLAAMPNCYSGTSGRGEKTFFSILCTCARKYPDQLETFAERFNTEKCIPPFNRKELLHKIKDALRVAGKQRTVSTPKPQKPWDQSHSEYCPELFTKIVQNTENIDAAYLWWRSPIEPGSQNAASFLKHICEPGDQIFVTDCLRKKKPSVLVQVKPVMYEPELEQISQNNESGVWYLPNPVCGEFVESDSGKSMRSEAAITSCRYCVIESDTVPEPD